MELGWRHSARSIHGQRCNLPVSPPRGWIECETPPELMTQILK